MEDLKKKRAATLASAPAAEAAAPVRPPSSLAPASAPIAFEPKAPAPPSLSPIDRVTPPPQSAPIYARWWFWAAAGTIVAVSAIGIVIATRPSPCRVEDGGICGTPTVPMY